MSKKVIRLTESELKEYISKVVAEQTAPVAPAPATPKIPLTGGTPNLDELKGKAVQLVSVDQQGYYDCLVTNARQTDNIIYIFVNCENHPEFKYIMYQIYGSNELMIIGPKQVKVTCGGLQNWLKKNAKPIEKKFDMVKNGGSNKNFDFA